MRPANRGHVNPPLPTLHHPTASVRYRQVLYSGHLTVTRSRVAGAGGTGATMAEDAKALLERVRAELKGEGGTNRLVPLIASGEAPLGALRALAAEEDRIVRSDWRAFLTFAAQSTGTAQRE